MSDSPWSVDWYVATKRGLVAALGAGPLETNGTRAPLLRTLDGIAFAAYFFPVIVAAITRQQAAAAVNLIADEHSYAGRAVLDQYLDQYDHTSGAFRDDTIEASGTIALSDWLQAAPADAVGWKRWQKSAMAWPEALRPAYRPAVADGRAYQAAVWSQVRGLAYGWTQLVAASVQAIQDSGANLADSMSAPAIASTMSAVRRICAALDTLADAPVYDASASILGGYHAAVDAAHEATVTLGHDLGQVAGDAANLVGEVAGKAGTGFFSEVGMTGLLVAGIAAAIALH